MDVDRPEKTKDSKLQVGVLLSQHYNERCQDTPQPGSHSHQAHGRLGGKLYIQCCHVGDRTTHNNFPLFDHRPNGSVLELH